MKVKDFFGKLQGVDEFDVFGGHVHYKKTAFLEEYGEDTLDEVFLETQEDDAWVVAKVFLKF